MKTTVWGTCKRLGEPVEVRNAAGLTVGAYAIDDVELDLPAAGLEIDCDHDGRAVGRVVYAEIGDQSQLQVVGVLDNDGLAEVEQPVYVSGSYVSTDGLMQRSSIISRARLLGVSLTFSPATGGAARPVEWRAGDLLNAVDIFRWPCSWRSQHPLLERALAYRSGLRARSAERIVDRRVGGDDYRPPLSSYELWKAGDWRSLPGVLRKSAHRGRILSVR